MRRPSSCVLALACASFGCSASGSGGDTEASETSGGSATSDGTVSSDASSSSDSDGGATGSTATGGGSSDDGSDATTESSSSSTTEAATDEGDGGSGTTGGVAEDPCDLFAPNCAPGTKCAVDPRGALSESECVPIDPEPDAVGEPCTRAGGEDSCEVGALCVDDGSGTGVCFATCTGWPWHPSCEDPALGCFMPTPTDAPVCTEPCDPRAQDCGDGWGCFPSREAFLCGPAGAAGQAEPCARQSDCAPGHACADGATVAGCAAALCCTPICDLSAGDPDEGCGDGETCQTWFDGEAGLEDLGVCRP